MQKNIPFLLSALSILFLFPGCSDRKEPQAAEPTSEYKNISDLLTQTEYADWELVTDVSGFSGRYKESQMSTVWSSEGPPAGTFFPEDNPISYQFDSIPAYQQKVTCIENELGERFILRHKQSRQGGDEIGNG